MSTKFLIKPFLNYKLENEERVFKIRLETTS